MRLSIVQPPKGTEMLKKLLSRSRFDDRTHSLYEIVVAQARQPLLFREFGVPDTLDGRFELVVLHALLAMRRLRACGERGEAMSQKLFDIMFADFDRALRELGVGDLSVGRRIKKMAQAFYGRASALDEALDAEDPGTLDEVLRRNVFGTVEPDDSDVVRLAGYVRNQAGYLSAQPDGDFLHASFTFAAVSVADAD